MQQPIRKTIKEEHPDLANQEKRYVLLVDGNNLLNISMVDDKMNSKGLHVGGIFQFLLQIKMMLKKGNSGFNHCYVMWDGEDSGVLRYNLYPLYKANRGKNYGEYNKAINDYMKKIIEHSREKYAKKTEEKEDFERERLSIMKYLEELFIRQVRVDKVEGDDLIAYYVKNKKPNEKIVILSTDRDYLQLIRDDVAVYIPTKLKTFITPKNHKEMMGYPQENALLRKILLGDVSDNIKGIKGLGEKTIDKYFPEFKSNKVTLDEIKEKAKTINEERISNKQKPLEVCNNIINGVSEGCCEGEDFYTLNKSVIDLSEPLLTDEAIEVMNGLMDSPIDPEGRSFQNLYKMIIKDDIIDLRDDNKFSSFFSDFKRLTNKEIEYYKKVTN